MAIKLNTIKCPECGAHLSVEEGREKLFCSYCGAQIILTNENEYIYRHVDEAKIKQAEADRAIQLKKLEIIENSRRSSERTKKIKIIISIAGGILGILLLICGLGMGGLVGFIVLECVAFIWLGHDDRENDAEIYFGDKVRVPSSISDYESKDFATVEGILYNAGFTNIRCVALNDLKTALFKKPGTVKSITINGREIVSGGKKFPSDSLVIISYHSFS